MKRWMFILLGGAGVIAVVWASFMAIDDPQLASTYSAASMHIMEGVAALLGVCMAWGGFVGAKNASEQIVRDDYRKSRRDHQVAGEEITFSCPSCHKIYKASPLLAGRGFMCRECQARFDVPKTSRALPAPAR